MGWVLGMEDEARLCRVVLDFICIGQGGENFKSRFVFFSHGLPLKDPLGTSSSLDVSAFQAAFFAVCSGDYMVRGSRGWRS